MSIKNRSILYLPFLMFAGLLFVHSCQEAPTAAFYYEPLFNPEVGDTIFFTNESEGASEYEWFFGNGDSSELESPYTIYDYVTNYKVTLNAINSGGNDTVSMNIDVNFATILGFYIFEPDSVTMLQNCNIWIYSDSASFYDDADPALTSITNSDGVAAFENLENITYYISIFKETPDGLYLREGFTQPLELNAINLYAIVMKFIPGGSMDAIMEEKRMKNGFGVMKSLKDLSEYNRVSSILFPRDH